MFREIDREADQRMEQREKRRLLMETEIEKEWRAEERSHQIEIQQMWMDVMRTMLRPAPCQYQPCSAYPQPTLFPPFPNQNLPHRHMDRTTKRNI